MIVVISLGINVNQKFLLKDSILSYLNVKAIGQKDVLFFSLTCYPNPHLHLRSEARIWP